MTENASSSVQGPVGAPVVHLLTVGDELLAGDIVDGNKARMAARARALGLEVRRAVSVRDRIDEIVAALREARDEAHVCLVSGGLGPTTDDLTTAAVAKAAGRPLRRDPDAVERLREKFRRFGVAQMPEANLKQADFPEGAEILPNPIGSAEGLMCVLSREPSGASADGADEPSGSSEHGCLVFVMPGVPRELERMLAEQVEPRLTARLGARFALRPIPRRIHRVLGMGESTVAARIEGLLARARERSPGLAAMYVHYRASIQHVMVVLEGTAGADGEQATEDELASLDEEMKEALAPGLYGIGEVELAPRVVEALIGANLRFATAESCTGGGLGALITTVSGSSACFRGGIISYDNEIKERLLGVPGDMLATFGAVSEPVARAMALGARTQLRTDLAAGITGIAGPGGGSPEKPVGTVHIAIADGAETFHKALQLRGDRGTVQAASVLWALKLLWDRLLARGIASITERNPPRESPRDS
ncbi:nicotinamide-nucleotide amidohydrolase family protein [Paraliomyxa miuraensis]|uniref:nicotinamide-nucleotide amidohydrolase family protein n=1 Tax=Paraliomyxa miuraensis TaxID=376150 RepID=UPI002254B0CD|nr:nicotinamide-nucleotide amidohydrolase family protein [Paraliomyxa miuraensis]MCX4247371.1 nicotinamide-nucleotide amidohydrolase family protein [Paraliomyxa miuraensis]